MGGRGSSSGGGSGGGGGKPVSSMMARVYYNASKKSSALRREETVIKDSKLERAAQSGKLDFIDNIKDKAEATRVREYYSDRISETERKIAKLGSADALYKNQKLAKEHRNLISASNKAASKMHEFSKKIEAGNTNIHDTSRTTTTYDRARKRRMSQFDDWFFGSNKK